jgi:hypothetical protein
MKATNLRYLTTGLIISVLLFGCLAAPIVTSNDIPITKVIDKSSPKMMSETSQCETGEYLCNSKCVNLQKDEKNCGTCGTICHRSQVCRNGKCEPKSTGSFEATKSMNATNTTTNTTKPQNTTNTTLLGKLVNPGVNQTLTLGPGPSNASSHMELAIGGLNAEGDDCTIDLPDGLKEPGTVKGTQCCSIFHSDKCVDLPKSNGQSTSSGPISSVRPTIPVRPIKST